MVKFRFKVGSLILVKFDLAISLFRVELGNIAVPASYVSAPALNSIMGMMLLSVKPKTEGSTMLLVYKPYARSASRTRSLNVLNNPIGAVISILCPTEARVYRSTPTSSLLSSKGFRILLTGFKAFNLTSREDQDPRINLIVLLTVCQRRSIVKKWESASHVLIVIMQNHRKTVRSRQWHSRRLCLSTAPSPPLKFYESSARPQDR
jgi:hypothetical protein